MRVRPQQRVSRYRRGVYGRRPGRARPGPAGVAAVVALLALAVVAIVIAGRAGGDGESSADTRALRADIVRLETDLAGLRKAVRDLARQALADLDRSAANRTALAKRTQLLARCLPQLQDEIDDLHIYLSGGAPPRTTRVSGGCLTLLKPRFGG